MGSAAFTFTTVTGVAAGQVFLISGTEYFTVASVAGSVVTMTAAATIAHPSGGSADRQGTVVSYGQGDYINGVVTPFYGTLANRWSNLVAVWQCWNEANLGDFRGRGTYYNTKNFTPGTYVPGLNSAYLSEFQVALSFARTAIRAHSLAPITTNAGSTVAIYHSTVQTQFLVFFGAIYPYLDGLSLDMYDGMDPSTVATSVGYLRALQTNFAKPLYISEYGEFGIAGDPTYTEALQAQIIPQQMAGLAQANPLAIILYRYADNDDAPFEHNEHLGLKRADGTHKPAFDTFFAATLPPAPTIVSITPSSAGTTTGGQATITGTNFFVGRTVVTFGGSPSPLVTVVADTTLTCLIPAHDATGSTLLAVTTPGGTASRADLFAYTFSPPAVGTSTGIVTYATNAVIGMQDVGAGALVAHIYAPAPLGTADDLRTHIGTLTVADGDVVMSQANRFDGHDLTFQEGDKDVVNALVLRAQMDLEEDGLGIVARGLVVSPKQAVTENGDGTVTVHLDNLTTELDQTNLGLRYVDRQEIGQIVRNMGNAQTAGESVFLGRDGTGHALTNIIYGTPIGWRADYLDDRTIETSAAPVQWNPNAGDNLGGVLVDLVANGNSVRRDVLVQTQYLTPSACGVPAHDDATQPWEMTYQIVVPTDADAGINQYPSPGYGVQFGFRHGIAQDSAGVWTYSVRVIDGYTVVGGLVVPANTRFKVALDRTFSTPRFLYSIQRPTDPVFSLVYAGGAAAQLPYYPAAVIRNAGGEVSNATIVHDVPMSRIWWAVNYNSPSNLGGLIQLAQDTGMFVRQAIDAITATPQRAMEFGPLGENSGITLVSVNGADINRLKTNPRKRIIREVTEYASVDNTVTVLTPLGGGTDPAQLDLARCFLMLNDPTYVNYGAQNFPEYDPDYTIHMLATYGGGPEYYIRYEPAFVPGGVGEIRGQPYINQELAYPPDGATIAEQELAARTLYAAAVVQLQAGMRPRVTFSATLVGYGRPPRAGSKVAVDYTHLGAQQIGIRSPETFIPLRITASPAEDGLWRVLQVSRHYGQGEPVDTVILSSSGRYGDAIEAATGEQRQQIAIQVVGKTTSVPMMASLPLEALDAANPIVHSFHIDESCYRITKARFRVRFGPYMQPVRTSKNPSGTPVVATGAVPIELPTPADINLSGTFNTAGTGAPGTTDGFDLVQKGQDNDAVVKITVENDGGNLPLGQRMNVNLHTPGGVTPYYTLSTGGAPNGAVIGASMSINFTKAKTQSTFTAPIAKRVAAKDTTIAHIPAGTVLANEPQHVHDVDPDLHALTNPTQITVQIDSGDGLFVDRSVQVSDGSQTGPWTGDFIFECSRFFGGPGRDVQVRFSSTDNADHGRGGLRISYTLVGEYQSAGTEGVGV